MSVRGPLGSTRARRRTRQPAALPDRAPGADRAKTAAGASSFATGQAGHPFSRAIVPLASQLSFPASKARRSAGSANVESAAGALTLNERCTSRARCPSSRISRGGGFRGRPVGGGAGARRTINFDSRTVTGVDQSQPALGAVTPGQIASGRYFSAAARPGDPRRRLRPLEEPRRRRHRSRSAARRSHIVGLASRRSAASPPTSTSSWPRSRSCPTGGPGQHHPGAGDAGEPRRASQHNRRASAAPGHDGEGPGRPRRRLAGRPRTCPRSSARPSSGRPPAAVLIASLLTLSSVASASASSAR